MNILQVYFPSTSFLRADTALVSGNFIVLPVILGTTGPSRMNSVSTMRVSFGFFSVQFTSEGQDEIVFFFA